MNDRTCTIAIPIRMDRDGDKAIAVDTGETDVGSDGFEREKWAFLPKSVLTYERAEGKGDSEITMPFWLVREKGLEWAIIDSESNSEI